MADKQKNNAEEKGAQERQNPETLDNAYRNLEDTEEIKKEIEDGRTPEKQKTPDELLKDKQNDKTNSEEKEDKTRTIKEQDDLSTRSERTQQELLDMLKKQQEQEERATKNEQDRSEMNLTRKVTSDEALKNWLKRTLNVDAEKVERVRTGTHSYKYEIYNSKGEEVGDELLSSTIAGNDPRRLIWVLNNEGHYEKKEVDSIVLARNGMYGFATDRGNATLTDIPTSYMVTRLPGGEFIAVQALEQQGRNRESSSIMAVREVTAQKKSLYEIEKDVEAAKTAEDVEAVQEDKTTDIREVEIVKFLKEQGLDENEINEIFKTVYDGVVKQGMTYDQAEKTVFLVKDLKEQGCSMNKIKEILEKQPNKTSKSEEKDRIPGGYEGRTPKRF